ncbi:hypothetical protein ACFQ0E_13830 [Lysobacter brunescens]|uniref:Uncharacterized protein n=1 Tax=Lysobacter brunescens TaxID=262323 RepID=A0ABW2YDQ3_9GAMM
MERASAAPEASQPVESMHRIDSLHRFSALYSIIESHHHRAERTHAGLDD